jgi:hypothetical protein
MTERNSNSIANNVPNIVYIASDMCPLLAKYMEIIPLMPNIVNINRLGRGRHLS